MWLTDFEEAIAAVKEIMGNCCYTNISCSWDGSAFIFCTSIPDSTKLVYYRNSGRIEIHYADTWTNPEHRDILKEGN